MQIHKVSDEQIKTMFELAEKAKANTYPKAGGYAVTVLTKGGNIYEGVSFNSDTLY